MHARAARPQRNCHLPNETSYGVSASSPNDNIPIRIARDDVTGRTERHARDIFGLLTTVEHTEPFVQMIAGVDRPKCNVILSGRHNLVAIQWMAFKCNDCIDRALQCERGKDKEKSETNW